MPLALGGHASSLADLAHSVSFIRIDSSNKKRAWQTLRVQAVDNLVYTKNTPYVSAWIAKLGCSAVSLAATHPCMPGAINTNSTSQTSQISQKQQNSKKPETIAGQKACLRQAAASSLAASKIDYYYYYYYYLSLVAVFDVL